MNVLSAALVLSVCCLESSLSLSRNDVSAFVCLSLDNHSLTFDSPSFFRNSSSLLVCCCRTHANESAPAKYEYDGTTFQLIEKNGMKVSCCASALIILLLVFAMYKLHCRHIFAVSVLNWCCCVSLDVLHQHCCHYALSHPQITLISFVKAYASKRVTRYLEFGTTAVRHKKRPLL